jgi:hypothetical protein
MGASTNNLVRRAAVPSVVLGEHPRIVILVEMSLA